MNGMKRTSNLLVLASMLSIMILCVTLTGCAGISAEKSTAPVQNEQSPLASEDVPSMDTKEYYFQEDGIRHIRLYSENITASFEYYSGWHDQGGNPRFENLIPLEQDVPQDKLGKKVPRMALIERDWQNFEHRLAEVNYDLKVHSSLEQDIDKIVYRLLVIDDVIPFDSELIYEGGVIWLNTEIFDRFVEENVSIEIIDEGSGAEPSGLSWLVYSGGCFPSVGKNDDVTLCGEHLFNVWLVDLAGPTITIWDMKYVEEPGCGKLLPMYRDS